MVPYEDLKWDRQGNDLLVLVPESLQKAPPCEYAWTIKISELEK